MPFDNQYNREIKQKIINIARRKIDHDNILAHNPTTVDPTSQQEFMTVTHPEIHGGSGNLAATSFDLGLEPKTVGGDLKVKKVNKRRQKKLIDALEGTQPITATGVTASGVTASGKPKRVRVKKVGGDAPPETAAKEVHVMSATGKPKRTRAKKTAGSFDDVMRVAGDVVSGVSKTLPYVAPLLLAAGKEKKAKAPQKETEWNTLVAKTRKEKGLSLKDTLKYIKEHNLYQKKTKEKGGSARLTLNADNIKASQGDMAPEMVVRGNVKSLKYS